MCQMYGRKVKQGVSMEMRENETFSELCSVNYLQNILVSIMHTHLEHIVKAQDKQALGKMG